MSNQLDVALTNLCKITTNLLKTASKLLDRQIAKEFPDLYKEERDAKVKKKRSRH